MRILRVLLLILLGLTLPLQGIAAMLAAEPPCAMDAPAGRHVPLLKAHGSERAPPCCNDAAALARTGKLCKSALDCQSAGLALLPPVLALAGSPQPGALRLPLLPLRLDAAPARIWRPPFHPLTT